MRAPAARLLAAAALLAACAPRRIVAVAPPGLATEESPLAGRALSLAQFTVRNAGKKDTKAGENALRSQFVDYLRVLGRYADVVDGQGGEGRVTLRADFYLELVDKKDYLLGFPTFFPGWGLIWPIKPRKGHATVSGTATYLDAEGNILGSRAWTKAVPFACTLYCWYTAKPLEEAYRAAYEEVFARLAVPPPMSRPAPASPAAAAPARILNSTVDRPAYRARERPDHFALVIGVENYSAAPRADFAERDAESLRRHLRALGYPDRNILLLTGSQASRANIEKYVESWLPANVGPGATVLVFFSGHGAPDPISGEAYLVPWDGDVKFLANTGYPLRRLYRRLGDLRGARVVVALDSCFSGSGGRSLLAKGTRPLVARALSDADLPAGLSLLTATGADEVTGTDEREGHGLFTFYLLEALQARKGRATLAELYEYLRPRVQDAARRQNRDQTPQLRLPAGSGPQSLAD